MFRRWLSGFINNNREKISLLLKVLGATAIVVFIMAGIMRMNNKHDNNSIDQAQTVYKPRETIIEGGKVETQEYEEHSSYVETFVNYCSEGKVNEAYNMLSDECKGNLYKTVEEFKTKYCDKYFSTKKEYTLQSWVNNTNTVTYQMRIMEDMMYSGEYKSGEIYQDYITVTENNGETKISINGYIGQEEINKTSNIDGIEVIVKKRDKYMDYEEYTLEVTNYTENTIMMDSMERPAYSLVLVNTNNYDPVITNSISYIELMVDPQEKREMKIQFSKRYTSNVKVDYILFSNIVMDYSEFSKDKDNYSGFVKMKVEL